MRIMSLNEVLDNMYYNTTSFIKEKNNELERDYFRDHNNAPLGEIMQGKGFEDNFERYKTIIRNASPETVDEMFVLLREYFLFSYGHDLMYKRKLEADLFTTAPITLIHSKLVEAVKEKYNDISVMEENPNFDKNIQGLGNIIDTFVDMQTVLHILYCSDFQFPNGWERMCHTDSKEVIEQLKKSGITIGDYLNALIDDKCDIIKEILNEIQDKDLRNTYLKELEELREHKHKETEEFTHVELPITYFLDHTFVDFLRMEHKSKIYTEDKPKVNQKLYIPNSKKDD